MDSLINYKEEAWDILHGNAENTMDWACKYEDIFKDTRKKKDIYEKEAVGM